MQPLLHKHSTLCYICTLFVRYSDKHQDPQTSCYSSCIFYTVYSLRFEVYNQSQGNGADHRFLTWKVMIGSAVIKKTRISIEIIPNVQYHDVECSSH